MGKMAGQSDISRRPLQGRLPYASLCFKYSLVVTVLSLLNIKEKYAKNTLFTNFNTITDAIS
jgi:hypothetical protein